MGSSSRSPRERKSQRALAERAATHLRMYGEVFYPLENQYIEGIQQMGEGRFYDRAMGGAASQARGAYEPEIAAARRKMTGAGVDPSSGAYQSQSNALASAAERAMGQVSADAGLNQSDRRLIGMQNIVRMGQGLAQDTMRSEIDLANTRANVLRSQAQADITDRTARGQAVGTALGMAGRYGLNRFMQNPNSAPPQTPTYDLRSNLDRGQQYA